MSFQKEKGTHLKTPHIISTNPIAETVNVGSNILIQSRISEGGDLRVVRQELVDETIVQLANPIQSGLKIETLLIHDDCNEVMPIVAASLPIIASVLG
jgi:hypothetical protein